MSAAPAPAPAAPAVAPAAVPRARVLVARLVAILAAASWLVFPGFGIPDLAVTWNADWAVVLEAGWGLYSTVIVVGALGYLVWRPRTPAPALTQLLVAAVALAVAAMAAGAPLALLLVGALALQTALLGLLLGARPLLHTPRPRTPLSPRRVLPRLAWSVAGAVGAAGYAVVMTRAALADQPVDVSVGVDHYVVQAALALAVGALAVLGTVVAQRPGGDTATAGARRLFLGSAGVAAGYLGLVSLCWQGQDGGYGAVLSALTLVWAAGLLALAR